MKRASSSALSWLIATALCASSNLLILTGAFTAPVSKAASHRVRTVHLSLSRDTGAASKTDEPSSRQRRTVVSSILSAPILVLSSATNAADIPSVTSDEFDIILKSSSKSISIVELSGPKSETCLVKLVDGTQFTVSDLIESSTDPRSPLKLVARCRLYNVPVKNVGLLSAVGITGASGKKKKTYANERVRAAEEKNAEKRQRMEEDERERLAELYRQQQQDGGL
ncbi:hypothetical protein ACHAXN_003278 [Cyclotella atomus]